MPNNFDKSTIRLKNVAVEGRYKSDSTENSDRNIIRYTDLIITRNQLLDYFRFFFVT